MGRQKIEGARIYFSFDAEKLQNECKICHSMFKTNHHGTLEKHLIDLHKLEAAEVAKKKIEEKKRRGVDSNQDSQSCSPNKKLSVNMSGPKLMRLCVELISTLDLIS